MVANLPKHIKKLCGEIEKSGGHAFLVGGCVRDLLLNQKPTDYDLEVFDLPFAKLKKVVSKHGQIIEAGKTFGVIKIINPNHPDIDVSLPRKDSKISPGHKGFKIITDPGLSFKQAARRRDFTINSIFFDPLTSQIIDPFNGVKDLFNKILRVTDPKLFADDPLRALRAVQFAARFDLKISKQSQALIKKTAAKLSELSKDRIFQEWKKLFLKSAKPSIGLQAAFDLNILKQFGLIFGRLAKTKQSKTWHTEGNVWIHTKLVVDKMAGLMSAQNLSQNEKLTFMLAALCHDFGKPQTTQIIKGNLRSFGHAEAGVPEAIKFLRAIGTPDQITKDAANLTKHHMRIHSLVRAPEKPSDKSIKRLVRQLANHNLSIFQLYLLSLADWTGRHEAAKRHGYPQAEKLYKRAQTLKINQGPAKSILSGAELIKHGLKPGPNLGQVLRLADQLADEGQTKKQILKLVGKITQNRSENNAILDLHKKLKSIQRK